MARRLVNLWKLGEPDYARLYGLYLVHLMLQDRYEEMVPACKTIRRYAQAGPGIKEAFFTFNREVEALNVKLRFTEALKVTKLRDLVWYGTSDHDKIVRDPHDFSWMIYTLAPLHYYLGKYECGAWILEAALKICFSYHTKESFYWFRSVAPQRMSKYLPVHVSLSTFYRVLGKDLLTWTEWDRFARGFTARFYQTMGITANQLQQDPSLLKPIVRKLRGLEASGHPCDFEPRRKVIHFPSNETEEEKQVRVQNLNRQLREYFPDLNLKST
jgi:hypothetical protein